MKTHTIEAPTGRSDILIGETLLNLPKYVPEEKAVIITDVNVWNLYRELFPPWPAIKIGVGESAKELDTCKSIYGELLAQEADRSSFIVGIGGGVVCDVAGFVASTYLRGVQFGFVSTTLLSQVDASVGGKNGVNFDRYKNIIGVFHQPEFVICDMNMLKTLPQKEVLSGFGEIVKHAAIASSEMFSYIEANTHKALDLEGEVIEKLVLDSVLIKSSIVDQDEKESGVRRLLNFGHTFGHAFETIADASHGEAVSVGMRLAAAFSEKRGLLDHADLVRIETLLNRFNLPTNLPVSQTQVLNALRKDKKRKGDMIHFVMLKRIGDAVVEQIPFEDLERETRTLFPAQ